MRILIISNNFFKAEGTIAKGIVTALPQFTIYFFSVTELKYRKNIFDKLLKSVDIVHWLFNVAHFNAEDITIFRSINIPQVATVHHVCPEELIKIEKASYANLIHVVSTEWKEFIHKHTNSPVALAPLGINSDRFKKINSKLYNKGEFRIGMMGFYPGKYNRKRFDIALNVFKALKTKQIEFKLILHGGGWEKYFKEFKKYNIPYEHYKMTADQNVFKFFEKIHVYLCTSDFEGGPLPVLESLASGIPVVSTNTGISADLLTVGGGILCSKGDVISLTNALIRLKCNNLEYLKLAGEAKNVASNYDWKTLADSYHTMYLKALENWEVLHQNKWKNNKAIINGKKQREEELIFDNLHQTKSLLSNGVTYKAILLGIPLLFNQTVELYRRWSLFKTLISFAIWPKK